LDDHDLNEHLCLTAARHLGLPAANSTIAEFAGERVVVVERYDRDVGPDGQVSRVHQEDTCQALGVPPTSKYQNEGGPGAGQIVELLRTNAPAADGTTAITRFVDALAFNWIIGGTDAHAKNYSILLAGPQIRLAPLYDVASALVYDEFLAPRLRMAMSIGGEYRVAAVCGLHWRRLATAVDLNPDAVVGRVRELSDRVADGFAAAVREPAVRELDARLAARFVDRIARSAGQCRERMAR
jgi:serine/threonine-protein kinase HipA